MRIVQYINWHSIYEITNNTPCVISAYIISLNSKFLVYVCQDIAYTTYTPYNHSSSINVLEGKVSSLGQSQYRQYNQYIICQHSASIICQEGRLRIRDREILTRDYICKEILNI